MKDQVLSKEQMLELINMGVDVSKASMCWNYNDEHSYWALVVNFTHSPYLEGEIIPTFTLQNIVEMLPRELKPFTDNKSWKKVWLRLIPYAGDRWCMEYENPDELFYRSDGENPLEAAFNMLKWYKKWSEENQ